MLHFRSLDKSMAFHADLYWLTKPAAAATVQAMPHEAGISLWAHFTPLALLMPLHHPLQALLRGVVPGSFPCALGPEPEVTTGLRRFVIIDDNIERTYGQQIRKVSGWRQCCCCCCCSGAVADQLL
jgi:hypothetical protein